MDDEIQLISDGDGLAVVGEPAAVEKFLRSAGLWAASKELDLCRLKRLVGLGSNVLQGASEIAADSARWIRLTEESARLVQEHGLMESKTPGVSHLMVGVPGDIRKWLQTEQGVGSILTNPAALSGVAGLMAQLASQQATAEITAYLAAIDLKVDEVLRKQDDVVLARVIGAGFVIEEAMTVRESTASVNQVTWGKVEGTSETIGNAQGYAMLQLKAIAKRLEDAKRVGRLAAVEQAETEVKEWLAVLARCAQLQGHLDILELDRVLSVAPGELNQHRVGLQAARRNRLDDIAQYTEPLLDRIDAACGTANAKMLWHRTNAMVVLESGNAVAAGVHDFQESLGIPSEARSWEPRQLERPAELAAQTIQKTKDTAPSVAAAGALLVGGIVLKNKVLGDDSASE
jgi:hypothetical protein